MDLNLKGNLVIVVGGGQEGLKKVNSLLTQNCKILVISDKINSSLSNYIKKKKNIKFKKTKLDNADFLLKYKPFLVMATTDNGELNRRIVFQARKQNSYAYAADDPEISDFAHPSVINIEDTVQIAISTGGRSPAMARKLKIRTQKVLKQIIQKQDISQIKLQQVARDAAKKKIAAPKERKKFLYSVLNDSEIKQLIKDNHMKKAQNRAMAMLREWK